MAAPSAPRPGRSLLVVLLALVGLWGGVFALSSHTPKLGLDLRGGTSVSLTAQAPPGHKVTKGELSQAVSIIRQRVNGLGVNEAEVTTQGSDGIVVSVPGKGRQEVVSLVGQTAQLRFRQVLQAASGAPTVTPSVTPAPSGSAAPSGSSSPASSAKPSPSATSNGRALGQALLRPAAASATPSGSASPAPSGSASPAPSGSASPAPSASPGRPTYYSGMSPADPQTAFAKLDCSNPQARTGGVLDQPTKQIIACSQDGSEKFLLAPAAVNGDQISSADAGLDTQGTGQWQVLLSFKGKGRGQWCDVTTKANSQPQGSAQRRVAIVLDGVVQSAPNIIEPICAGNAQITGNFTQKQAQDLANVLKYGALPLTFPKDKWLVENVSPTLGSDQLRGGLIAGAIGLGLVILYSLLYYRGLGLVTVASLALSAALLFPVVVLLGAAIGYTLTLAGIAGFIVAVGITADSFVVFFERIRDEVREGRAVSIRSAVERAWPRARRTILSADTVSILAAAVLYLLSIGSVRGFAFTLGLSTLSDLFIVFLFTKPLVTFLVRTRLYAASSKFSGLGGGRMGGALSTPSAPSRARAERGA